MSYSAQEKLLKKSALAMEYGCKCAYCGKETTLQRATLDHYLPRALGGGMRQENLRLCCRVCQRKKGCLHPDEWNEVLARPRWCR